MLQGHEGAFGMNIAKQSVTSKLHEAVGAVLGIDVAKAAQDVCIGSAATAFTVANDEGGIRDLIRQLVGRLCDS
jgi:hypothetical protein